MANHSEEEDNTAFDSFWHVHESIWVLSIPGGGESGAHVLWGALSGVGTSTSAAVSDLTDTSWLVVVVGGEVDKGVHRFC